ncbi:hypothetical protein OAS39_11130 [Pirellulales bacterium]|nr:hypothetical protein [Pirellulales bacterium]
MDTNQIEEWVENQDYGSLAALLDDVDRRWSEEGDLTYFDDLSRVLEALENREDLPPEGQKIILSVVKRAFEKDVAGGVKKYELLIRQADFLPMLMRDDLFGDGATLRALRCSLAAKFMAKINDVRDPDYEPVEVLTTVPMPYVEDAKPGDFPLGGTMNPEDIKNPEMKKMLEKSIRQNQENLEANQVVSESNQLYARFEPELAEFFASQYRDDPENVAELQTVLQKGKFSEEFADDVLQKVK